MKNEHKQFKTSDFYTASYLRARGFKIATVDFADPRRALFVFEDNKDRQCLIEDFLFGRASVEPKSFVVAIKELKQLLHSNTP